MTLAKVCSGLMGFGLMLGMTAAVGQPPGKDEKPQKAPPPKPATDELEAAIVASANHPDVRLAQAKLQMAQAELDQAKMLVAQRIAATHAKLKAAKDQFDIEAKRYDAMSRSSIAKGERLALDLTLAQAKAALAAAEAEWQAARGQAPGRLDATADSVGGRLRLHLDATAEHRAYLDVIARQQLLVEKANPPAPGSAADKLRELVGKRVKLDLKDPIPFDAAMAEFVKQAGLTDLTVRSPEWANERSLKDPPKVGPLVGVQTVAGWFQLILDDFNRSLVTVGVPPEYQGKHEVYVRDYGLLITKTDLAPPGAPTLAEFARQVQAERATKADPKK